MEGTSALLPSPPHSWLSLHPLLPSPVLSSPSPPASPRVCCSRLAPPLCWQVPPALWGTRGGGVGLGGQQGQELGSQPSLAGATEGPGLVGPRWEPVALGSRKHGACLSEGRAWPQPRAGPGGPWAGPRPAGGCPSDEPALSSPLPQGPRPPCPGKAEGLSAEHAKEAGQDQVQRPQERRLPRPSGVSKCLGHRMRGRNTPEDTSDLAPGQRGAEGPCEYASRASWGRGTPLCVAADPGPLSGQGATPRLGGPAGRGLGQAASFPGRSDTDGAHSCSPPKPQPHWGGALPSLGMFGPVTGFLLLPRWFSG